VRSRPASVMTMTMTLNSIADSTNPLFRVPLNERTLSKDDLHSMEMEMITSETLLPRSEHLSMVMATTTSASTVMATTTSASTVTEMTTSASMEMATTTSASMVTATTTRERKS
jgi:hypothetical protein